MAGEPLESLHLALMQEVLPVGLAMVDRVRRGGPKEVIAAFEGGEADPLTRLRQEGQAAARQVRDSLDQVQPGLGNPVVQVSVRDVPAEEPAAAVAEASPEPQDPAELQRALARILERLDQLESRLLSRETASSPATARP